VYKNHSKITKDISLFLQSRRRRYRHCHRISYLIPHRRHLSQCRRQFGTRIKATVNTITTVFTSKTAVVTSKLASATLDSSAVIEANKVIATGIQTINAVIAAIASVITVVNAINTATTATKAVKYGLSVVLYRY
jgi:hypothetical protein